LACDQFDGKRDGIFTHALDIIEGKKKERKLLDVGCGCGFLLKKAFERGWAVCGIDPSEQSVEYAKNVLAAPVVQGTLEQFHSDEKFDVITMINVFDHLTQPWEELKKVYILLEPGGYIFLRFPNGRLHSLLYEIARKVSIENHVKKILIFHEYSLTPCFVKKLLIDCGFVDIDVQNAKPTAGNWMSSHFKKLMYCAAEIFSLVSCRKILLGTSLSVIARKPDL
jgi:trans-aconitate methyltransferase